jgi:HK97 family phage prohead protease
MNRHGWHHYRGRNPHQLRDAVLDGNPAALRAMLRHASGPNTLTHWTAPMQIRDASTTGRLTFTGYASISDTPYEVSDWLGTYTETIRRDAFTKTLARDGLDVIFTYNHDWDSIPMARTTSHTLTLTSDETGLFTSATLDASRSDVANLRSAMLDGTVNAMSFAFYVTDQTWSNEYESRDIMELDMHGGDVSAVTWPANPATTGSTGLRQQARALIASDAPALLGERVNREMRADGSLSPETAACSSRCPRPPGRCGRSPGRGKTDARERSRRPQP